jgi:hypothetical protein
MDRSVYPMLVVKVDVVAAKAAHPSLNALGLAGHSTHAVGVPLDPEPGVAVSSISVVSLVSLGLNVW